MPEVERRVIWYIKTWECANGNDKKVKYPVVTDGALPRKGSRRCERSIRQAEKNALGAKHELALILNNNFLAARDWFLTMTCDDAGYDRLVMRAGTNERDALYDAMKQEAANWLRRGKRACRGEAEELRAVYVISDMDGKTKERARPHIHAVVSGELTAECAKKWTMGDVRITPLRAGGHGDLTGVAEYLIDQVRTRPGEKRYHPTRNLEKPEAKRQEAKSPDYPLQVPAGCTLVWRSETVPGMSQVIRYYRPPEKRRRARKKRKGGKGDGGYIRGANMPCVQAPGRDEKDPRGPGGSA